MTATAEPGTTCWAVRESGEPVPAWAERMARDYATAHPGALARLDAAGQADTRAHTRDTDMDSQPDTVMASLETQVTIRQLTVLAAEITTGLADDCQEPEQWTLTTLIARAAGLHGDPARFAIFRLISGQAGPAASLPGINDLGGQDPYPRYGADANDMDQEACHD